MGVGRSSLFERLSTGASIAVVLAVVVLGIVASLANLVAAGAAVRVASNSILGQPISVADAYRESLGRFLSLLVASIVAGVPIAVLFLIVCIGWPFAVFIGLGWSLIFQAIMLEEYGGFGALGRSWALVADNRWRLLACLVLIGLITALLVSIPSGLFGFIAGIVAVASGGNETAMIATNVGNTFFQAIGQILFGAIGYVTTTLLYYDLRVRKEAYDLQQRLPQVEIVQPGQYPQYQSPPQAPGYPPYPQQSPQYPPQAPGYPQYPPQVPPPPPPPGYPPQDQGYPPQAPPNR